MRHFVKTCVLLGLSINFYFAPSASADQAMPEDASSTAVEASLGLATLIRNDVYKGLSRDAAFFPLIDVYYGKLKFDKTKITYDLMRNRHMLVKPYIGVEFGGYNASDSAFLEGMSDRDLAVMAGVEAQYFNKYFYVGLNAGQDISGNSDGMKAQAQIGVSKRYRNGLFLSLSANMTYLDQDFADYYYGVRADEARVGRAEYRVSDVFMPGGTAFARFKINDKWSAAVIATYAHLTNEIGNSPIVRTRHKRSVILGLQYSF